MYGPSSKSCDAESEKLKFSSFCNPEWLGLLGACDQMLGLVGCSSEVPGFRVFLLLKNFSKTSLSEVLVFNLVHFKTEKQVLKRKH